MKTIKIIILVSLLILTTIITNPSVLSEETQAILYVDDDGNEEYSTISEALNNATDGDTIYVYNGVYQGYFLINKSINLIGESKENTIIVGENFMISSNSLVTIIKDNVTVSGFTIKNSTHSYHLFLHGVAPPTWIYDVAIGIIVKSNYCNITGNIIKDNHGYGILLNKSHNTIISNNEIKNHTFACIYVKNSTNNKIFGNNIIDNLNGIMFHMNSTENTLYHNNFINNTWYNAHSESNNLFYNADLKEGNYWDDYGGVDKNNNAIGDFAYNVSGEVCQDLYPLMSFYEGRLIVEKYYVDEVSVQLMLLVGIIISIIFCLPIGLWWRKKYFK